METGISGAAKNLKTGKTYTGKTNSKGYTIISAPAGKYQVKWKSGHVSKTKTLTASIPKGKYRTVSWTVADEQHTKPIYPTPQPGTDTTYDNYDWSANGFEREF